jgi:membrane-associated phospholipid phosphatase
VRAETNGRGHEHPLLGMPRRDIVTVVLLILATATLCALVAFDRGRIQPIDDAFLRRMISVRSGPLTAAAKMLNFLGLVYVTLTVRVLIALFLALRRRWWHVAAFVSAVVVAEACVGPIKSIYDRARPPVSLVATSSSSFPSGHAIAAASTAVAAVVALFPEGPKRYAWGVCAVLFSLLMGVSRAYLGAHWLSDAVAGVLIGTTAALGTAVLVHVIRDRRGRQAGLLEPRPSRPEPEIMVR